jgi:ABC-type dipeptide/oligopeptide/nickel transport system ATPase component
VQAQIMEALQARSETGAAMVLITHDLGVIAGQADRVLVMYAGKLVEIGTAEDIFYTPRMPYTFGPAGQPAPLDRPSERLTPIGGAPPSWSTCRRGARSPRAARWPARSATDGNRSWTTTGPGPLAALPPVRGADGRDPGEVFETAWRHQRVAHVGRGGPPRTERSS